MAPRADFTVVDPADFMREVEDETSVNFPLYFVGRRFTDWL